MRILDGSLARDGCVLRYDDHDSSGGSAPSVLFLHGAGTDHVMFEAQAQALSATGFRTVLVDLRDHGASRPNTSTMSAELLIKDVEALIAHLGLDHPGLVGHSLGGNLAQRLVRREPGKYSALAVLDSTWNTGPLTRLEQLGLKVAAPLLRLIPRHRLPLLMADASATTDRARKDLVRAFSQQSKTEFLAVWQATTQFLMPDQHYRTAIPLMLLRGGQDRTGNIASAMPRWAAAEGVDELLIPGAGHVVTQDAPTTVSAALCDFMLAHVKAD